MKIAIIGSRGYPYVYSGYETFVSELSSRLVKKGHSITVYCHKGLFKEHPSVVNGVHLMYLPAIETKSISQLSHSLLSTLHSVFRSYDVLLYVNSANGPFGLITTIARKRTAINVDGLEWLRPKWKGLGAKYFYFSSWLSTKLFDVVIADSDRMADIYRKEFNSGSTTIAYGANAAFSTDPELIGKFGLKKNDYYLIVGRLIPDNNADIIVRGFERSRSKKKLVVVGDVPYRDSYAEGIKRTSDPRIMFVGYVNDPNMLRELYCNSFAYFHGHEFGGTNPTLLKALAYGCGIIALDTVFSREVLLDGKHGIFFQKNEEAVASAVNEAEDNPSRIEALRLTSRERISSHYTWEKIACQYEELFSSMLSND